jgi:hypothetical protein
MDCRVKPGNDEGARDDETRETRASVIPTVRKSE